MKTNTILMGDSGAGKTTAIKTLHKLGLTCLVIATEPGIEHILGDITCNEGMHWCYVPPTTPSWAALQKSTKAVLETANYEAVMALAKGPANEHAQFLKLIEVCSNFICDRCKKSFGPIDGLDDSYAFILDGLDGVNEMARDMTARGRPVLHKSEWQPAQQSIMAFLRKCLYDTKCSFILIAHIERSTDEITLASIVGIHALGRAISPEIPVPFDEVILAYKDDKTGSGFRWATYRVGYETKSRLLPVSNNLEPDFKLIFNRAKEKKV